MAFCTDCGFKLPESAAFCPNCGHRLAKPTVEAPQKETAASEIDAPIAPAESVPVAVPVAPAAAATKTATGPVPAPRSFYGSDYNLGYPSGGNTFNPPPKKSGMKTAFIIFGVCVLAMIVIAVLIALQLFKIGMDHEPIGTTEPAIVESLPGARYNTIAGSGYVDNGDYYVSFIGAEQFTDMDNQPAIRIYYEFTNNYVHPQAAGYCMEWEITQDGRALEYAYCWEDVDVYYNDMLSVRTGVKIQCCLQFKYNPNGGKVDLTMFGWYDGEEGGTVSATYVPGSLPGAPRPFEFKSVADPQWTTQLESSGTLDDELWHVAVTDAELLDDYNGESAIRVFYEFTNNSGKAASFGSALYLRTYQDGASLMETYADAESETDRNLSRDIADGETITASCVFLLRNTSSNVEAEVEAANSYDAVGQTYKLSASSVAED